MSIKDVQLLTGIGAYLVILIVVSLWYVRRSNTNIEEYFLAKRGFGPWLTALSAEASDMSGWLLLGLPGVAFFTGLGEAFWTALGLFIGTCVNWVLVAKRLRTYSQVADNAITVPEFFSKRYHDNKRILLAIAAIISLLFFSIYVGAQFITFGKMFNNLFGVNMTVMVILSAAVVLFYTMFGGIWAVGMTDVMQGLLMVTILVLVMFFGFFHAGGVSGVAENLRNFPHFLDFFGVADPQGISGGVPIFGAAGTSYSFLTILSIMAWGLGYFGMPHVLVRFMAIRKTSMLRRSITIAIIWCFVAQFAAVSIGLLGRSIFPGAFGSGAEAENIFILMTQTFFPPLLAGVVVSGILAASMSSSDSYMLIVSSSLANDIFRDVIKKDATEKQVFWVARITMFSVAVFGICIALFGNQSIFRVVSYAWAGLGASFGPLILFSLFWKRTNFAGALAGMLTGGCMVLLWKNVIAKLHPVLNVYELLPAFIISCLVIVCVSLATKKPSEEIEKEFETAKTIEF
jgi:sodium/proline symporter